MHGHVVNHSGISAQGGLPAILELHRPDLGRKIPRRVGPENHALENRADEEGGQVYPQTQAAHFELV